MHQTYRKGNVTFLFAHYAIVSTYKTRGDNFDCVLFFKKKSQSERRASYNSPSVRMGGSGGPRDGSSTSGGSAGSRGSTSAFRGFRSKS